MDLFDVVKACFRRWYVVLPLIAISVVSAMQVYKSVQPVYYANAVVGMAPANSQVQFAAPGSGLPRNGLMEAAGPSFIAQLVVLAMKDPGVVARVVADGGQPNYEVKMFPVLPNSPQLPLLMVEATEPDPASSQKTVQVVSQQVPVVLRQVQAQAGVPDELQVRGISPAPPSPPVAAAPSRTKSGVALILGGVLLSILAAVIVDTVLSRRKSRKSAARAGVSGAADVPADSPITHAAGDKQFRTAALAPAERE